MKTKVLPALLSIFLFAVMAKGAQMEVAFSLQGGNLTWFSVSDPSQQGTLNFTGLPTNFDGNALAYDAASERLLFVSGPASTNHALWALNLAGLTLNTGASIDAGAVTSIGNLTFGQSTELYGGAYYNGSYYCLVNGTDTLRKVDFAADGSIASQSSINLPGNNTMFLGDITFDSNGDLWISGSNDSNPTDASSRLWSFSTVDGVNFTTVSQFNNPGLRYNGILFDTLDQLYGYRLGNSTYDLIDQSNGNATPVYTGTPFNTGGDLTNGFLIDVVPEPSIALLSGIGVMMLVRRRRI